MIISASRRTDIPAHYMPWLAGRFRAGAVYTRNPMNTKQVRKVNLSPDLIDGIVFWSKNPLPLLEHLELLSPYPYYIQYTLNPYGIEVEPRIPDRQASIDTFRSLVDAVGNRRVVWRYDPIVVNQAHPHVWHMEQFAHIAAQLSGYTQRVMVSFVDFYKKIENTLKEHNIAEVSQGDKVKLLSGFAQIAKQNRLEVRTCAELIDGRRFGVQHGSCIDAELLSKIAKKRIWVEKDKNQRPQCGCALSVDIGSYDSCPLGCVYCYANRNQVSTEKNVRNHDPSAPFLNSNHRVEDIVKDEGGYRQLNLWNGKEQ